MERHFLRVSCKCALYTLDGTKVLLSEYAESDYGLPGGHMEEGEVPDEAMLRELYEELGIRDVLLEHRDFWMHENGKLLLGYVGILDESTPLVIQDSELSGAKWIRIEDIKSKTIIVGSYDEFILENQPKVS